jgi:hypothetical protein
MLIPLNVWERDDGGGSRDESWTSMGNWKARSILGIQLAFQEECMPGKMCLLSENDGNS